MDVKEFHSKYFLLLYYLRSKCAVSASLAWSEKEEDEVENEEVLLEQLLKLSTWLTENIYIHLTLYTEQCSVYKYNFLLRLQTTKYFVNPVCQQVGQPTNFPYVHPCCSSQNDLTVRVCVINETQLAVTTILNCVDSRCTFGDYFLRLLMKFTDWVMKYSILVPAINTRIETGKINIDCHYFFVNGNDFKHESLLINNVFHFSVKHENRQSAHTIVNACEKNKPFYMQVNPIQFSVMTSSNLTRNSPCRCFVSADLMTVWNMVCSHTYEPNI